MSFRSIALTLACALPAAAHADLGYDSLEVQYLKTGFETEAVPPVLPSFDESGNGYALRASFHGGSEWFFTVDYHASDVDLEYLDVGLEMELTDIALMAGFRKPLSETTDVYAKFGYESAEFSIGVPEFAFEASVDGAGAALDLGVRSQVNDSVELNAHLGYSDLGDLDSLTKLGVGAMFGIDERFGVTLNYDRWSGDGVDFTGFALGLRAGF